jgi:hypothetical protein
MFNGALVELNPPGCRVNEKGEGRWCPTDAMIDAMDDAIGSTGRDWAPCFRLP